MTILPVDAPTATPASSLSPRQRLRLALDALSGLPVADLAAGHHVSRKFVYQQRRHAEQALHLAFDPPTQPDDLLFWLPVTKPWLQQLVLSLVLVCHSSIRGVHELLRDVFDHPLSLGSIHNVLTRAVDTAAAVNHSQDLSAVRIGAHDEIFQAGKPVLVGVDSDSTYCYLLSQEEHRDGDTWVRLLELQQRGFAPEATIADAASGLRCGQHQALPSVACRGDVFHPLRDFQALVRHLDSRAYQALQRRIDLERQQSRFERRKGRKNRSVASQLAYAGPAEEQAIALADDVRILLRWWRDDVLAVAGPDYATRQELHDWIVAELRIREKQCEHRIGPVRRALENQGEDLLSFARQLDAEVGQLAGAFEIPAALVREALAVQQQDEGQGRRWRREEGLWRLLGGRYALLRVAVTALAARVVRASSVIENVNSRLRNYFFLRKQLGKGYLELLQFSLNHRRYSRSERGERVGKSPRELLTGQEHGHWLELLGYQRFTRN